jgi:hypothetical protein
MTESVNPNLLTVLDVVMGILILYIYKVFSFVIRGTASREVVSELIDAFVVGAVVGYALGAFNLLHLGYALGRVLHRSGLL